MVGFVKLDLPKFCDARLDVAKPACGPPWQKQSIDLAVKYPAPDLKLEVFDGPML